MQKEIIKITLIALFMVYSIAHGRVQCWSFFVCFFVCLIPPPLNTDYLFCISWKRDLTNGLKNEWVLQWQIRGLEYFSSVLLIKQIECLILKRTDCCFQIGHGKKDFTSSCATPWAHQQHRLTLSSWEELCACAGKPIAPRPFCTWASGQKGLESHPVGQTEAEVPLKKFMSPGEHSSDGWWNRIQRAVSGFRKREVFEFLLELE